MANNVNLPQNAKLASQALDNQHKIDIIKAKKGWIGRFWGSGDNAPNNIAGIVLMFCFLLGIIYTCLATNLPSSSKAPSILEFWQFLSPIITLTLGYIFGKEGNKNSQE